VNQPPPGQISTTVMFGRTPKKDNVSNGLRYRSRSTLAAVRVAECTAAWSA
jgi:hypothetical protein